MFAPEGTGGQFRWGVGGAVVADLAGGRVGRDFLPFSPGIEETALNGEDAVESGEKKGWAGAGCWRGIEKRDQFEGEAGRAEEVCGAASRFEGGEPGAEVFGVLLPAGAGFLTEELRGISAEKLVGLHGEGGHAVAGAFEEGGHVLAGTGDGGLDGLLPDGLFLERIEE